MNGQAVDLSKLQNIKNKKVLREESFKKCNKESNQLRLINVVLDPSCSYQVEISEHNSESEKSSFKGNSSIQSSFSNQSLGMCSILSPTIENEKVDDNDDVLAFLDSDQIQHVGSLSQRNNLKDQKKIFTQTSSK